MAAANFSVLSRRWLAKMLLNDPVLTELGITDVVEGRAGKGDTYPVIVVSTDAPFQPMYSVEQDVIMAQGNLRVRVVDQTDQLEKVAPAAQRLNELLEKVNTSPIPGGGEVGTCRWLREHEQQSVDSGEAYVGLGAVFRLTIKAPSQAS